MSTPPPRKGTIEKFGVQVDKAPLITVFGNGDRTHKGTRIAVNRKVIPTWEHFLKKLSKEVKIYSVTVLKLYDGDGKRIRSFEEIVDGGHYIACGGEVLNKTRVPVNLVGTLNTARTPSSSRKGTATAAAAPAAAAAAAAAPATADDNDGGGAAQGDKNYASETASAKERKGSTPLHPYVSPVKKKPIEKFGVQVQRGKRVLLFRNGDVLGDPVFFVINPRKYPTHEKAKLAFGEAVKSLTGATRKVYTVEGDIVKTLDDYEEGGCYICCGGTEPLDLSKLPRKAVHAHKERIAKQQEDQQ